MTGTIDRGDALEELVVIEASCAPGADYSERPQEWLSDTLAEYAWSIQREIWLSVVRNRATAVLSCNNSGKTWLAARIVVWWILTYFRQGVRVVTTAPTAAQVSLLLWQEIRAAYNRGRDLGQKMPGKIIGSPFPQWKIGDKTAGFGRKPADGAQSAMQGVHAAYVLAVVDEAGGVPQSIFDALDKILTNEAARVLAIGNPDDKTAPFGHITEPGSGWNVIRIDGLRTPNMTREIVIGPDPAAPRYPLLAALMRHEGIPYNTEEVPEKLRPVLLHPLWVEERFTRWCGIQPDVAARMDPPALGQLVADAAEQSQLFVAAVRGDFPEAGGDSVIPLGWVKRAMDRWQDWVEGSKARRIPPRLEPAGARILGIDVATTNGADDTVIAARQGHVVLYLRVYPEGDTLVTVDHAQEHLGANPAAAIAVVDNIGIGRGVMDVLQGQTRVNTVAFEASRQSDRTDRWGEFRFINDRAAGWWRLREMLDPAAGATLCLPPDPELLKELTAPRWWVTTTTKGGRIQIESKDQIRKRLGHSTDRADAVMQSVWIDGSPVNTASAQAAAIPYGKQGLHLPGVRPEGSAMSAHGGGGVVPYRLHDPDDDDNE